MSTPETRALIPGPREQTEIVVNCADLEQYFLHVGMIPSGMVPKHIDLSGYKPAIDHLYDNSQDAFVLPEDARIAMMQDIDSRGEPINDAIRKIRDNTKEHVNRKVPGERHIAIYHDSDDNTIRTSRVSFGKVNEVDTYTFELLRDGKTPLFGFHTHPDDVLFSPQDFYPMIADAGDGEGFIKGQVVLLPNSQILALSTSDTLCLDIDTAQEVVDNGVKKLHDVRNGRINSLLERVKKVDKYISQFHLDAFEALMQKCVAIENRMKAGEFDEKEALRLIDLDKNAHILRLEGEKPRHTRVKFKAWKMYYDLVNYETNRELIDFARSIGVQLYFSTDRKNFTAFTI